MDVGPKGGHRGTSAVALTVAPLVVMLIVGWAVFLGRIQDKQPLLPQPVTGLAVPEFWLPPLGGQEIGLADSDLRGAVSVVNFWAAWCAPCREEMPLLLELAQAGNFAIHGVNSRDQAVAARRFLTEVGNPFRRIGGDADGSVSSAWGVYGLPATFVVDANGRVAYALIGPLDRRAIQQDILPLIDRLAVGD